VLVVLISAYVAGFWRQAVGWQILFTTAFFLILVDYGLVIWTGKGLFDRFFRRPPEEPPK
jgi:hypothetical protein